MLEKSNTFTAASSVVVVVVVVAAAAFRVGLGVLFPFLLRNLAGLDHKVT
jgi:hypothetical protein